MVDITIYIEGVKLTNASAMTVDSSAFFRESFYELFSQKLHPTEFNLKIIPFGTVTLSKRWTYDGPKTGTGRRRS
ncbi:hypothetical protein MTBBW1_280015 [Desulfamplus magnetovallimortis]|uniref:Uncharacterized protein n=1 Tax=Desulfamplus magnetovallimortis TaxID=1246637 RepID=A0A1W1HFB4_9BACT|nr:hypothetical protein [Desulfamplus magnetovallimortis]SLM31179.1 hypothetical protein MTBBW1_280015 [Desulfamplus magnetovallimortis]